MGWSFRKSTSFGPFRLNFSKSGVGLSVGVKGARISVSRRGTYVNLGAGGIYYRQKIDGKSPSINDGNANFIPPVPANPRPSNTIQTITTDDVENVTDVDSQQFIDELESKANKISLFKWLGFWPSIFIIVGGLIFLNQAINVEEQKRDVFTVNKRSVNVRSSPVTESPSVHKAKQFEKYHVVLADSLGWVKVLYQSGPDKTGFIRADMGIISQEIFGQKETTRIKDKPWLRALFLLTLVLLVIWCIYLYRLDKRRKTLNLYYTLDNEIETLHHKFLGYFEEFASSKKVWQNLHVQGVSDKKYHAGASQLVSRAPVSKLALNKLPSQFLNTNVSVPYIGLRNTELFFFPERVILKRGSKFGAVFYKNIRIESANVRFIEEQAVPSDASVVDHTWKYLNKSGGPDKRFNGNYQIPICLYTEYSIESDSGINEVITTSKTGGMDSFCSFIKVIGDFQQRLN